MATRIAARHVVFRSPGRLRRVMDSRPPSERATVRDATTGATASGSLKLPAAPAAGSHVVITIGIDHYAAWPHLGNAVNDARGTSEVFRSLGFREASSLVNETATGDAIRQLASDGLSSLGVNDSLVVFFAGHGGTKTRVLRDGTTIKTGYIIPVDAENKEGQVATWIRLDTWLDDIARLPPNHILVILDACHGGIALESLVRWRDVETWHSDPENQLSRRRSRRVIVSALDDQLALDGGPLVGHSLFTGYLIQALTGGLPREGRRYASGTELGLYLQTHVREYPNSRQTPDFGAFELDERGELMIPLFPSLPSPSARLPAVGVDANAALRHKLAILLAEFVPDRIAITHVVAAHAPMIQTAELPSGQATTIWMYVLVELTNNGAYAEISAIVDATRRRSRRSRRIDWSVFSVLLRQPAVPVVASWSHLALDLRRDSASVDPAGTALITDGDTLLEAIITLRWGGVRPPDPRIKVTSYQLIGRTRPLLHEVTVLPGQGVDTARWLVKIPVPRARIRTRRVTVRCVDTDLRERRYVVPRAGSICAAIVWLAFAVFAWRWLAPVSRLLLTAPLSAFGVLSGLWSSIGVHLLRRSHNKRSFSSMFFTWELAVVFAALATLLVILIPPRAFVLVTNTTKKDIALGDITIPSDTKQQVYPQSINDRNPTLPFCRCHDADDPEDACKECSHQQPSIHGVAHFVLGCLEGDCEQIVQRYHDGGKARVTRPIGKPPGPPRPLSPLTFEPGAADTRMSVTAHGEEIKIDEVEQLPSMSMTLPVLPPATADASPPESGFSITFSHRGWQLRCPAKASRIVALAIEPRPAFDTVAVTLGQLTSTWHASPGTDELRACADPAWDSNGVKLEITPEGELECRGGHVERVMSFEARMSSRRVQIKIGDVESTWTAKTAPINGFRACLGNLEDIELPRLAPGDQVVLPSTSPAQRSNKGTGSTPQFRIRTPDGDLVSIASCHAGDTVRAVQLAGVSSDRLKRIAGALATPLDDTTAVTCQPRSPRAEGDDHCELMDKELTCWTAYHGSCQLLTSNEPRPGGKSDACPSLASPMEVEFARKRGAQRHLFCREVYRCE